MQLALRKTENFIAQAYLIWKAPGKYPSVALTRDLLLTLKWEIWPFSVERRNQKGTKYILILFFLMLAPAASVKLLCFLFFSILLLLPVGQRVTKKEHFAFQFFCQRILPMIVPLPLLIFVRCLDYWDNAARAVVLDVSHVKAFKSKAFCNNDH